MNDYMESVLECDIRLNKIDHVYKSFYAFHTDYYSVGQNAGSGFVEL